MTSEIAKEWANEDRHGAQDQAFREWLGELNTLMTAWHEKHGNLPYELPINTKANEDNALAWRDSFDDGMTPQEAFDVDQSYWEE